MPSWTITTDQGDGLRRYQRDFGLTQGDALSLVYKIIASDVTPTTTPINLTNATATWRAWRRGCRTLAIAKEVGVGIIMTTPAAGVLTVQFNEDDTIQLDPGIYDWQLRLNAAGFPAVSVGGSMTLRQLVGELQTGDELTLNNDVLVL